MESDKERFKGGVHYYHRHGDGRGDGGPKALSWDERTKQLARSRRKRVWCVVGSLMLVLGVVVVAFLVLTP